MEENTKIENTGKTEEPEKRHKKKKSMISNKSFISIIALAVIMVAIAVIVVSVTAGKGPKVTTEVIMAKLEASSELTTAKMICTGLVSYSDGNIPFINEEAFTMTYSGTVRAGINLEDMGVEVTNDKVTLTVPAIEIQDISIDEESIHFFDNKFALFKDDSKDDVVEAVKQSKADIEQSAEIDELKEIAKQQINALMTGLFKDSIEDRELVIEFAA